MPGASTKWAIGDSDSARNSVHSIDLNGVDPEARTVLQYDVLTLHGQVHLAGSSREAKWPKRPEAAPSQSIQARMVAASRSC